MNCLALFSQERSSAKLRQVSRGDAERADVSTSQVAIQSADGMIRNHIEQAGNREGSDGRAACQRSSCMMPKVSVRLGKTKTSAAAKWEAKS